nr:hypothetical protein [Tanacetum cinerariifolium]
GISRARRAEERRAHGKCRHRRLDGRGCPVQRPVPQRADHSRTSRRRPASRAVRALRCDLAGAGRWPTDRAAVALVRMAAARRPRVWLCPGH